MGEILFFCKTDSLWVRTHATTQSLLLQHWLTFVSLAPALVADSPFLAHLLFTAYMYHKLFDFPSALLLSFDELTMPTTVEERDRDLLQHVAYLFCFWLVDVLIMERHVRRAL